MLTRRERTALGVAVAIVVGAIVAAAVASEPAWQRIFDNIHWTVSFTVAAGLAWQAQPTLGELRWTTGVRETERWLAFEVPANAELSARCGELACVLAPALRLRLEPARGRLELGWSWTQRTTPPGGGAGVVAGVDAGVGPGVCSGGGGGP